MSVCLGYKIRKLFTLIAGLEAEKLKAINLEKIIKILHRKGVPQNIKLCNYPLILL
jgi:hypothetical protein